MQTNQIKNLTNEQLLKRRNLLKGVVIGFLTIAVLAVGILIYLYATKGFENFNIATLIPVFALPVTLMPALSSLAMINKEMKVRGLK
ncbi:hypothetical protein [Flavobacterium fluviale]|uniref:Redox-active disulfide protein 2 n=1 Tax=Flavobacterium fluviale TaxID=2249356 RepID=A0A344LS09_9FLAO|nr:hypothetical protein [Flavobacterium fluviale]AXB56701.1 hypothetical protein HYN86_08845 [Flavobacterium fluviale]